MFSLETREKAKQSLISTLGTVVVLTSPSGEEMTFPSLREASRITGVERRAISSILRGSSTKWSKMGWKARLEEKGNTAPSTP
jgi:hypothetical protein